MRDYGQGDPTMPVTWQRKTFSQSNGGSDELLVCPTCGSTCTRDSAIIHAAWHLPEAKA